MDNYLPNPEKKWLRVLLQTLLLLLSFISILHIIVSSFVLTCPALFTDEICRNNSWWGGGPTYTAERWFFFSVVIEVFIARYLWIIPIVGLILSVISKRIGKVFKIYLISIFTVSIILFLLSFLRLIEFRQVENTGTNFRYNAAMIKLMETKEKLSKPTNLYQIEIENYGSNVDTTRINQSEVIQFSLIDGTAFRFDNCEKNTIEDENLKSYFEENKEVLILLPGDLYKKRYLGGGSDTTLVFHSEDKLSFKDKDGKVLEEFTNLSSRCDGIGYYQVWLDFLPKSKIKIEE